MKVRNFYPIQVLRQLQGEHTKFNAGQLAAVGFAARKGRKLGISLMVGSTATAADLLAVTSSQFAQAVLANTTNRVILKQAA